ncbi:YbaB/EbfC family nucleoid-associated protein [Nocardia jinanensis]|uniref:YbaB/EbfC DNA-binding family protein n=1 Tax=Nocardia jinanensis TaxID=382504 RepID=A0A917VNN1_9NOCA|nr:YbaB/EbfC family nucleoid-associated protein [Nocardia jinanensis]GGK99126.1 hypothetical protein GCM10011588_12210 [Nocardia jinanensis]
MNAAMDALELRASRQLNAIRDLSEALVAIRVRETSSDGAVTVEVDGNAALCDLVFSEAIAHLSPREFEAAVVATAGRAAKGAMVRRAELMNAFNRELAELSGSRSANADTNPEIGQAQGPRTDPAHAIRP